MPAAQVVKKRWPWMSRRERDQARQALDWQQERSQLTWADIDAVFDEIFDNTGHRTPKAVMLRWVLQSAHRTSDYILCIEPPVRIKNE